MRNLIKNRIKVEERPKEYPGVNGVEQCHHYWKIEVANGKTSKGVCKHCGESRYFFNAFPELNPMKKEKEKGSPFSLPEMPDIEVEAESKS